MREGRERYEQLLATTTDDFLRQRATLHLGELLMEHDNFTGGYTLLTTFVDTWPRYADSSGARMLRGYVAAELNRWDVAVADANAYLASPFADEHRGKAHLVLGRAALARGDYATAEKEFALVSDDGLNGEAKAGLGYCLARRDLRGAQAAFLEAARVAGNRACVPQYLYQAACLARELGDRDELARALSQLQTQDPNSHLLALLSGQPQTASQGSGEGTR